MAAVNKKQVGRYTAIEDWRGSVRAGAIAEAVRTAAETSPTAGSGQNGRRVAVL